MTNQYEPNKIYTDEFGRVSGIFLIDKPVGKTSHDIVDEFRRKFNTRKVGHAGALDPFATGLLIILIGKALKLADSFLGLDKDYEAEVAFGFKTETLDTEGKIIAVGESTKLSKELLVEVLKKFKPEYYQTVPIFSSVKVNGEKLRELARRSESFTLEKNADGSSQTKFYKEGKISRELPLPRKLVKIQELNLLSINNIEKDRYELDSNFKGQLELKGITEFKMAKIFASVSKGTYIRKLAEDIGDEIGIPAMLINLRRTRVGEYKLNKAN